MAEGVLVFGGGFADSGDGLAGDDEDVGRGLGINVAEGDAVFVFVFELAGDFSLHDFLKQCFFHWERFFVLCSWFFV